MTDKEFDELAWEALGGYAHEVPPKRLRAFADALIANKPVAAEAPKPGTMIFALDYDGTYTEDPGLWQAFIESLSSRGHGIVCVTMRHKSEPVAPELAKLVSVFYTGRRAKREFMRSAGIEVSVWIDDRPELVCFDSP